MRDRLSLSVACVVALAGCLPGLPGYEEEEAPTAPADTGAGTDARPPEDAGPAADVQAAQDVRRAEDGGVPPAPDVRQDTGGPAGDAAAEDAAAEDVGGGGCTCTSADVDPPEGAEGAVGCAVDGSQTMECRRSDGQCRWEAREECYSGGEPATNRACVAGECVDCPARFQAMGDNQCHMPESLPGTLVCRTSYNLDFHGASQVTCGSVTQPEDEFHPDYPEGLTRIVRHDRPEGGHLEIRDDETRIACRADDTTRHKVRVYCSCNPRIVTEANLRAWLAAGQPPACVHVQREGHGDCS